MPSRFISLAIILFWLGSSVWLFQREFLPSWQQGQPPSLLVDLIDEAQPNAPHVKWMIYKIPKDPTQPRILKGWGESFIRYQPDTDSFMLASETRLWTPYYNPKVPVPFDVNGIGAYVISRDGELRSMEMTLKMIRPPVDLEGGVRGTVKNGELIGRFWYKGTLLGRSFNDEWQLPDVRMRPHSSVLNSLQPIPRISGLRPGQQWHTTTVDPAFEGILAAAFEKFAPNMHAENIGRLDATVRDKTEPLTWGESKATDECYVIDYTGDDKQARTWVRVRDSLVLQQEFEFGGEHLIMVRND